MLAATSIQRDLIDDPNLFHGQRVDDRIVNDAGQERLGVRFALLSEGLDEPVSQGGYLVLGLRVFGNDNLMIVEGDRGKRADNLFNIRVIAISFIDDAFAAVSFRSRPF